MVPGSIMAERVITASVRRYEGQKSFGQIVSMVCSCMLRVQ
jgi:hypothetical protein